MFFLDLLEVVLFEGDIDEGFRRRVGLDDVDFSSEADEYVEADASSVFAFV